MSDPIERTALRTPRLTLVPMEPKHAGAIWEVIETSLPELRPWLVWTRSASPETTAEFVNASPRSWEEGSAYNFAVHEDEDLVGVCSLNIHNPFLTQGEIGYWMRTDRAGRGYTTEAARAVRDFAFDVVRRHRLNLRAGIGNLASCRVAEKIGFTREGTMRAGGSGYDGDYDCHLYGMLASDPRP